MENHGSRYPYPYGQYPYPYPYPAPYRPPPSSEPYPPPPNTQYNAPYYPYPPPPYATPPPYASPPPHQHPSGTHSGPLDYSHHNPQPSALSGPPDYPRHSFDYQPSPYPYPGHQPNPQPQGNFGNYGPRPHYPYQEPGQYQAPPPESKPQEPPPPPKTQGYPEYQRQDCLGSVAGTAPDNVSNSGSSYPPVDDLLGGLHISDNHPAPSGPQLSSYPSNSWQSRPPGELYGYPNSSFPSSPHLPILDRIDSSSSYTPGYASSESPHSADMQMTLFSKGSLKVLLLHGNLDIWIYHAQNLPNMDMFHKTLGDMFGKGQLNRKITSDPYVSVSVAGAVIGRTYVMSNSENPVWMQHFYVPVAHHAAEVHFVVKDSDVVGSQLIGLVTIPVEQIYSGAKIEGSYPILNSNGKPCKPGANLSLSIQYTPMEKLSVYHHGVGAGPDYQGVPGTYFPLRKGGTVTLYQDAHVPEGLLPSIRLDNGMPYEHGKCWYDMFVAIRQARRLIYITGWSVWHKVKLVRDKAGPASECTLGELLRSKSQEGVRVLLLIWDDPTSRSILGYKTDGVMATHDEEARRFFKHSSVQVLLCPRNAGKRHSWVKQREVGTIYTHHQKNVIVDADAGGNRRKIVAFVGGLDLCDGRYDTPQHPLFRTLLTVHKDDFHNPTFTARRLIYITGWSVWHKVKLVRDKAGPASECTLGELLRSKSQEGVRVLLLIWDDPTSRSILGYKTDGVMATHDEEARRFFKHSSVQVLLCPRNAGKRHSWVKQREVGTIYTHHQKNVIVDADAGGNRRKIVAFVGGLDLCDGRYDTPQHPLFRTLLTVHKDDFHNPTFTGNLSGCPREPWHDLHSKIDGPAAYDVLTNFEERWLKAAKPSGIKKFKTSYDDALLRIDRIPDILGVSDTPTVSENDPEAWHVQIFRSIDSNSVKGFPKDPKEATCKNLVCGKNVLIDMSIHTAYVKAIRAAQHFIYVENQYFIGSSYNWNAHKDIGANNLIPMEIALKIAEKIRANERFAAYIVIPMWPEGVPNGAATQRILYWQHKTMQMMYETVYKALVETGLEGAFSPQDYLNFFCLGNREMVDGIDNSGTGSPSNANTPQALSRKSRRFMIYVHSKGMVVDDEYIVIGSANINQRSMEGTRDTEIAMGAYQPQHTWARKYSGPRGQIYGYRMSLWAEHMATLDDCFTQPESIECVRKVRTMGERNWKQFAAEEVSDMRGHLLKYPVEVDRKGKVRPLLGSELFPDVGGNIVGSFIAIQENLTI